VHLIGVHFPNPKGVWETSRSPTLHTMVDLSRSELQNPSFCASCGRHWATLFTGGASFYLPSLNNLATFEATHSPLSASIDPHQEAAPKRVYLSLSSMSNRDTVASSNCGVQAGDFVAHPGANIGTKVSKLQWMGCSLFLPRSYCYKSI
jgi:hypothetical protein